MRHCSVEFSPFEGGTRAEGRRRVDQLRLLLGLRSSDDVGDVRVFAVSGARRLRGLFLALLAALHLVALSLLSLLLLATFLEGSSWLHKHSSDEAGASRVQRRRVFAQEE